MFKPHFPLLLDIKMRFLDSDNNSTIIGSLWQVWLGWTEDLPAGDLEAFLQLLLHLSASFPHSSSRTYPPFPPTKASAKTWLKFLGHSRPSYASPISPVPPPGRLIRRARKRRRSSGDLAKRRQRLLTYQYNQAHLFQHTSTRTIKTGVW